MMNLFTKTLVASSIASVLAASVNAAEPLTFYGTLNVSIQSNDVFDSLLNRHQSETMVQSNGSRVGVKGTFDLPYDLQTFYTVEYSVDTGYDSSDNFKARDQFVGLRGSFGSASLGRNNTVLRRSQGKVDEFNMLSGDIDSLFQGENRMSQTATYMSPSFEHFRVGLTYVAQGDSEQVFEYTEVRNGQTIRMRKKTDGYSVAGMYGDPNLKKSPVYMAVAYDHEVKGYNILRVTGQVKAGAVTLGAMYQQEEMSEKGSYKHGYLLSTSYNIQNVKLKAQYQDMEDKGKSWSVGTDYQLGEPTKLFAFYTLVDREGYSKDDEFFGVGIVHSF